MTKVQIVSRIHFSWLGQTSDILLGVKFERFKVKMAVISNQWLCVSFFFKLEICWSWRYIFENHCKKKFRLNQMSNKLEKLEQFSLNWLTFQVHTWFDKENFGRFTSCHRRLLTGFNSRTCCSFQSCTPFCSGCSCSSCCCSCTYSCGKSEQRSKISQKRPFRCRKCNQNRSHSCDKIA